MKSHVALIRASIGTEELRTPAKATRFVDLQGITTPANSSMSGLSADIAVLSGLADAYQMKRRVEHGLRR